MNLQEIIEYLIGHKWALKQGAGLLAKKLHTTPENVREAKKMYRGDNTVKPSNKYNRLPKVLVFDIETAPMKAFVWQLWKENICLDKIISDWFIICWSAKWLYSEEVMGDCLTPEEILNEDDKRVTVSLWKLFDEADMVVAHNGSKFDVPKMNCRFLKHNLVPPTPYYTIDTLQIAKKNFGFASNKLEALARFFGFDGKLNTEFNLWKKCMEGDQESLNYMLEYNKQDVILLEEVYLKLQPWIKGGPNVANYVSTLVPICSKCGSAELELIPNKYYYTTVGKYQLYRCKHCGAVSRGRVNLNQTPVITTTVLK